MEGRLPLTELINNQNDPNLLLLLTSEEDPMAIMQAIKESGEPVNNLLEKLKDYLAQPQAILNLMNAGLAVSLWRKITYLHFGDPKLNINEVEQGNLAIALHHCNSSYSYLKSNPNRIVEIINATKSVALEGSTLYPFHKKMLCTFFENCIDASSLPEESKKEFIRILKSELNPYSLVADGMQEERNDGSIRRKNEHEFKSELFPRKKVKEESTVFPDPSFRPPSPGGQGNGS